MKDDKFNKILKEIEEKLEKNPELKEEIQKSVEKIENILGYTVDVSIVYLDGLDEYGELAESEEYQKFDVFDESMTLSEFIEFINEEDGDLKICIDPLYLKGGINQITNVLTTTINDCVIVVPKA